MVRGVPRLTTSHDALKLRGRLRRRRWRRLEHRPRHRATRQRDLWRPTQSWNRADDRKCPSPGGNVEHVLRDGEGDHRGRRRFSSSATCARGGASHRRRAHCHARITAIASWTTTTTRRHPSDRRSQPSSPRRSSGSTRRTTRTEAHGPCPISGRGRSIVAASPTALTTKLSRLASSRARHPSHR